MAHTYTNKENKCDVDFQYLSGELKYLALALSGGISAIPSTSNNRMIVAHKTGRPRLIVHPRHKSRLNEMRNAYLTGLIQKHADPRQVSFGKTPVHIMVLLSKLNNRCDSHNLSKSLCDWLEDIGVIDNDKAAQCWCARRTDYAAGTPTDSTLIMIRPFNDVRDHCAAAIGNLLLPGNV